MDVLAESIRSINCSAGISREKNATPSFRSIALSAILSTNAVFPIAGLAAMITKSPLPNPLVFSLRFRNPVSVPINLEFPKDLRRSISSIIARAISLESLKSSFVLSCVISYSFFSTRFMISITGRSSSIVTFLISVASVASARLVDLALISPRYAAVLESALAARTSSIAVSSNFPIETILLRKNSSSMGFSSATNVSIAVKRY